MDGGATDIRRGDMITGKPILMGNLLHQLKIAEAMDIAFKQYATQIGCRVLQDEVQVFTARQRKLLSQRWEALCQEYDIKPPGGSFKK
jgi:hypothetical protein